MTSEDRAIVEAIQSGDTAAFESLYAKYFRRIQNFSIRKLGDVAEAEDVTQEVFEAVFRCLDRFEGKSDLVVWIFGITRNILNNRLRRRGGVRLVSIDDVPPEVAPTDLGPAARAEAREALFHVETAIEGLPVEQRRILELRHAERMSIRKIAQVTERSEDAVKSSLYRARRTLAATLPKSGPGALA